MITFFSLQARAFLAKGEIIKIGDQEYKVTMKLGEGGLKSVYQVKKLNCPEVQQRCYLAIGIYHPPEKGLKEKFLKLNDQLVKSESLHIRTEIPMVKMTKVGAKGEFYGSVMEYGPSDFVELKDISYESIRLLLEDAYKGVWDLKKSGLSVIDIKNGNMLLMGELPSDENIKSGKSYLALSDFDELFRPKVDKIPLSEGKYIISTGMRPPEFLHYKNEISNSGNLWQVGAAFYEKVVGGVLFSESDLRVISFWNSDSKRKRNGALRLYEKRMHEFHQQIQSMINHQERKGDYIQAKALREIEEILSNSFKLDPKERQFWPAGIKQRRVGLEDAKRLRPKVNHDLLVRDSKDIDLKKLNQFYKDNPSVDPCDLPLHLRFRRQLLEIQEEIENLVK